MTRIKNWSKLQHFKDRTPPWIKLYRDILDDPDWHDLDGSTVKVLIGLWLIASEDKDHEGRLPEPRKLAFRLRISETQLNQALTKLSHWLIFDDITPISPRYQVDAPERERETETETETEGEAYKPQRTKRATQLPDDFAPNDTAAELASQLGIRMQTELPKFHDYYTGRGKPMKDWQATFRNWLRNAKAFGRTATPAEQKSERQREWLNKLTGRDDDAIDSTARLVG